MYNKPLTFAATTLLLCSPVMILTSCEGEKDSAAQAPALVPEVQVTKLVTKDVPIRQEWVGTLRGTEDAEIRSQVTGYLLSKDYRDGAYVKKGQVLFQIDPRPFQATLDQAQGRLEQYEATLKKYKLDVERYTPLVKTGSVRRKQLDDALQQVQETEAAIATAKAQVDEAKINLKFTTITAPISGLAGLATPSIGNLLTPSSPTPLTTISSIDPIRVDFSVTGKQVLSRLMDGTVNVKTGRMGDMPDFELILEDGSVFEKKGKVVSVDSEVSRSTGTVNFIGHIPNPDLKLRSGMAVRVRAVTGTEKDASLVPARALLSSMNHRNIMVVAPDGTPRRIDVQPGETVVLDMPDGKGGTAPMLMQIVTGTVKPIPESLKEIGYGKPADAPVIVEGGMMAAQYSKANSLMREHGATEGFGTVVPVPFIYTAPVSSTPSVTAK